VNFSVSSSVALTRVSIMIVPASLCREAVVRASIASVDADVMMSIGTVMVCSTLSFCRNLT